MNSWSWRDIHCVKIQVYTKLQLKQEANARLENTMSSHPTFVLSTLCSPASSFLSIWRSSSTLKPSSSSPLICLQYKTVKSFLLTWTFPFLPQTKFSESHNQYGTNLKHYLSPRLASVSCSFKPLYLLCSTWKLIRENKISL